MFDLILASDWYVSEGESASRVVLRKQWETGLYVTHIQVAPLEPARESFYIGGHYDMTLNLAIPDYEYRLRQEQSGRRIAERVSY